MIRLWIGVAGLGGLLSLSAAAYAAHFAAGEPATEALLRTAAEYGLIHAASLLALAAIVQKRERPSLLFALAGWGFSAGIPLFSGSLILLAIGGPESLALLTPFGGAALLLGWAALLFAAWGRF